MTKLKITIGLFGALCAIAVSAAPASAEFKSTTGKSTGSLRTEGLNYEVGGCEKGAGEWTIKNKAGESAPNGPKLNQALTFEGCKIETSSGKIPVENFKCEVQVTETGETSGTESLLSPCTVKTPGKGSCEMSVAGKELKTTSLTNVGTEELKIDSNLEEVEAKPNAVCQELGIRRRIIIIIWIEWQQQLLN
jgi:hypothetical protein